MSCETDAINRFTKGQTVRLSVDVTDENDELVDPDTLTFKILSPVTGTETEYEFGTDAELVQDLEGKFHVDFDVAEAGTWFYQYTAVKDDITQVIDREFVVARSQFS